MSFKYKIVCFCVHSVFYVLVLVCRQFYSFIRSFAPCMFVFVHERVFLCALHLRVCVRVRVCKCVHVCVCTMLQFERPGRAGLRPNSLFGCQQNSPPYPVFSLDLWAHFDWWQLGNICVAGKQEFSRHKTKLVGRPWWQTIIYFHSRGPAKSGRSLWENLTLTSALKCVNNDRTPTYPQAE